MTIAHQLEQRGLQQGIQQGAYKVKREIALKLLKKGELIEVIAELTGLSMQDLELLKHVKE